MSTDELYARALTMISRDFRDSSLDARVLSRRLHVSQRQLYRAFAGRPGVSETVARCRVAAFIASCREPEENCTQKPFQAVGFASYETLRMWVRRLCGISPGAAEMATFEPTSLLVNDLQNVLRNHHDRVVSTEKRLPLSR